MLLFQLVFVSLIVLGGAWLLNRAKSLSTSVAVFTLSGAHFILLGKLLSLDIMAIPGLGSSSGAGPLFSADVLTALEPLVYVGFGWIGLIMGLQLEINQLSRLGRRNWQTGTIQNLAAGGVMLIGLLLLPRWWPVDMDLSRPWPSLALVLACVAMVSSPIPINYITSKYRLRGKHISYVQFLSNIDGIFGIIAFQLVVLVVTQPTPVFGITLATLQWLALSLVIAIIMGVASHFILLYKLAENNLLAMIIGLLAFTGGISFSLGLSPMFINLIVGFIIVNYSDRSRVVFSTLATAEQPVFVSLAVLAGATWQFPPTTAIPTIIVVMLVYFFAKMASGYLGAIAVPSGSKSPSTFGFLFLAQGPIALAFAISIGLNFQSKSASVFQSVVIGIYLLTAFLASRLERFHLHREGLLLYRERARGAS